MTSPTATETLGVNANSYKVVAPTYFKIGVTWSDVWW